MQGLGLVFLMWLVVGLGNPGAEYEGNRHNVGFMVVDQLADRAGLGAWRSKLGGALTSGTIAAQPVVLCKPLKFMNCSGEVVSPVARFFRIEPTELVVVHDELDLDFGRVQIKQGGGSAGHKGLVSIVEQLGREDFIRVRLGIGRPTRGTPTRYVLNDFTQAEKADLATYIGTGAEAVEAIVGKGLVAAMNQFNRRKDKNDAVDA